MLCMVCASVTGCTMVKLLCIGLCFYHRVHYGYPLFVQGLRKTSLRRILDRTKSPSMCAKGLSALKVVAIVIGLFSLVSGVCTAGALSSVTQSLSKSR